MLLPCLIKRRAIKKKQNVIHCLVACSSILGPVTFELSRETGTSKNVFILQTSVKIDLLSLVLIIPAFQHKIYLLISG